MECGEKLEEEKKCSGISNSVVVQTKHDQTKLLILAFIPSLYPLPV